MVSRSSVPLKVVRVPRLHLHRLSSRSLWTSGQAIARPHARSARGGGCPPASPARRPTDSSPPCSPSRRSGRAYAPPLDASLSIGWHAQVVMNDCSKQYWEKLSAILGDEDISSSGRMDTAFDMLESPRSDPICPCSQGCSLELLFPTKNAPSGPDQQPAHPAIALLRDVPLPLDLAGTPLSRTSPRYPSTSCGPRKRPT
jgi:hypothetical protein